MKKMILALSLLAFVFFNTAVLAQVPCTKTWAGDYWYECPRDGCSYPSGKSTKYGNFKYVCADGSSHQYAEVMYKGGCGSCTNWAPWA